MNTNEKTRELIGLFTALGLTRSYAKHLACNYMQAYIENAHVAMLGVPEDKAEFLISEPDPPPPLLPFLEREWASFPDEWQGVGLELCYTYALRLIESWRVESWRDPSLD